MASSASSVPGPSRPTAAAANALGLRGVVQDVTDRRLPAERSPARALARTLGLTVSSSDELRDPLDEIAPRVVGRSRRDSVLDDRRHFADRRGRVYTCRRDEIGELVRLAHGTGSTEQVVEPLPARASADDVPHRHGHDRSPSASLLDRVGLDMEANPYVGIEPQHQHGWAGDPEVTDVDGLFAA